MQFRRLTQWIAEETKYFFNYEEDDESDDEDEEENKKPTFFEKIEKKVGENKYPFFSDYSFGVEKGSLEFLGSCLINNQKLESLSLLNAAINKNPKEFEIFCEFLVNLADLHVLNLSKNELSPLICKHLAKVLACNSSLKLLVLS